MCGPSQILKALIAFSHDLGREDRGLVILGEGNTSADCGDGTFWIKASGHQLYNIDASGFCRVNLAEVIAAMERDHAGDAATMKALRGALVDPEQSQPSVETFLHAVCLAESDAKWVAHTHPIAVNSILCSQLGAKPFMQHLFPDAIVVCGRRPAVVSYADPGVSLAWAARDELCRFRGAHGEAPKTMLITNHGLLALGQTAREALNITLMAEKWARILLGTCQFGGPHPLSESDVERIEHRTDERFRRRHLTRE